MHLDHISYATSHEKLIDVVQRIGGQLGASFFDGGIHPQFGTRNFVLPLKNSRYIEVVCPLDHPAADKTPFGRLVTEKVENGGGWLTWVIAVDNIELLETKLQRIAVEGHRRKPDGEELFWRQIGVLDTLAEASTPFFIEWISSAHPSMENESTVSLSSIEIYGDPIKLTDRYGLKDFFFTSNPQFNWLKGEDDVGIEAVTFATRFGDVRIN